MGPFSWPCYITGECINYLAMNIKAIKTEALLGSKESNRNLQVIHLTHLQLLPILTRKIVKKSLRIYTKHTQNMQKIPNKKKQERYAANYSPKPWPWRGKRQWRAAWVAHGEANHQVPNNMFPIWNGHHLVKSSCWWNTSLLGLWLYGISKATTLW